MPNRDKTIPGEIIRDKTTGLPVKNPSAGEIKGDQGTTTNLVHYVLGSNSNGSQGGTWGLLSPNYTANPKAPLESNSSMGIPEKYVRLNPDQMLTTSNIRKLLDKFTIQHPPSSRGEWGHWWHSSKPTDRQIITEKTYVHSNWEASDPAEQALARISMLQHMKKNAITFPTRYVESVSWSCHMAGGHIPAHWHTDPYNSTLQATNENSLLALKPTGNTVPINLEAKSLDTAITDSIKNNGLAEAYNVSYLLGQTAFALSASRDSIDQLARFNLIKKEHPELVDSADKKLSPEEQTRLEGLVNGLDTNNPELKKLRIEYHAALCTLHSHFQGDNKFTGKLSGDNNDLDRLKTYAERSDISAVEQEVARRALAEYRDVKKKIKTFKDKGLLEGDVLDTNMALTMFSNPTMVKTFTEAPEGRQYNTGFFWATRFSGLEQTAFDQVLDPASREKSDNLITMLRFEAAYMYDLTHNNIVENLGADRALGVQHIFDLESMITKLTKPEDSNSPETAFFLNAAFQAHFVKPNPNSIPAKRAHAFQKLCTTFAAFDAGLDQNEIDTIFKHLEDGNYSRELQRYGFSRDDMQQIKTLAGPENLNSLKLALNELLQTAGIENKQGLKSLSHNVLARVGANVKTINKDNEISYFVIDGNQTDIDLKEASRVGRIGSDKKSDNRSGPDCYKAAQKFADPIRKLREEIVQDNVLYAAARTEQPAAEAPQFVNLTPKNNPAFSFTQIALNSPQQQANHQVNFGLLTLANHSQKPLFSLQH